MVSRILFSLPIRPFQSKRTEQMLFGDYDFDKQSKREGGLQAASSKLLQVTLPVFWVCCVEAA
jgi:hypothetical protein